MGRSRLLNPSFDQHVVAEVSNSHVSQRWQFRNFGKAQTADGRDRFVTADDFGGDENMNFIDQALVEEGTL